MIWALFLLAQSSTWYRLGYDALQRGDTVRALRFLYRAVEVDPHDRQAWMALLVFYEMNGEEDSVRALIERWKAAEPATALEFKGLHALRHDDLDEAWEAFHQVLQHDPRSYLAHLGIAEILYSRGQGDSALQYLKARYRENPVPLMDAALGMLFAKMHMPDSALPHLEKYTVRYKEDPRFLEALARAYLDARKFDRAKEILNQWEQIAPDERHWILLMRRELGEASQDTTLMLQANAALCEELGSVQGCLQAASFLSDLGQNLDQAEAYVEKALNRRPTPSVQAIAWNLQGDILLKRGDQAFATRRYREAMEFYARAKAAFEEALKVAPEGSRWADYAETQARRAEALRRKAYRKWQRIE